MIFSRGSTCEGARKAKNRPIRLDFQGLIFKSIRIDFSMPRIHKMHALHVRRSALLLALSTIGSAGLDGFVMRFDPFDVGHMSNMAASRRDR
ncbi:MAG: hypothetical protein C3F11_17640 [Methylocystaceae bacterium]|nr:MAG: hypothetical protein C3F11_17640 [Methylocystaceae bacterium]